MNARLLLCLLVAGAVTAGCSGSRAYYHAPETAAAPPSSMVAFHTAQPVAVDGEMNEAVWREAAPILLLRADGERATLATEVRVAWGPSALYLFFHCPDPDIWSTLDQHDAHLWEEEVVEAFIDADNDRAQYLEIEVNPRNAAFDAWITDPTAISIPDVIHFEAKGMLTAVKLEGTIDDRDDTDAYWNCEIAIPWEAFQETLGLPPAPGTSWGMNFYRVDQSGERSEYQAWNPTSGSFHQPWRFGAVYFLK